MNDKNIKRYLKGKIFLKGKHIYLALISLRNKERLAEILDDKTINRFTHVPYPYSVKNAEDYIKLAKKNKQKALSLDLGIFLKEDNLLIGKITFVDIIYRDNCATVGYLLDKIYRNQGFMSEAIRLILDFGFKKIKFNRIEINCSTKNKASRKVIEKTGAKFEGISRKKCFSGDKTWHDLRNYAILREDYKKKKQILNI